MIDSRVAPWSRADGPGVAVMVLYRGRIVHLRGYGLADVQRGLAISPQTQFELGSLTKQFTAAATLLLVERGKLALEDSVSRLLPEYAEHWHVITVRMLLNHTAGLRDFDRLFRDRGAAQNDFPRATPRADVQPESFHEMLADVAKMPAEFPPQSRFEYCNSCYLVLAELIERLTGTSFPRFLADNFFAPLGMQSTFVNTAAHLTGERLAHSYRREGDAWTALDFTPLDAVFGPSGVISTPSDLAKWYDALDSHSMLPAQLELEMFTSGRLVNGQKTDYGFGFVVDTTLGLQRAAHGGWWKGFRNIVLRYPQERLTIVLLSNDAGFADYREEIAFRIAKLFIGQRMRIPAIVSQRERDLQPYTGEYVTEDAEKYDVRLRNGALWVLTSTGDFKLLPIGKQRFVPAGLEEELFEFDRTAGGARLTRHQPGLGGTTWTVSVATRR